MSFHYLKHQRIHQRATIVKVIHRWIPTQSFLRTQNRAETSLCPLCQKHNETAVHILECPDELAHTYRQNALYSLLKKLLQINTSIHILATIEKYLSELLKIPSLSKYVPPTTPPNADLDHAIRHQNIVGWENFFRGFISNKWETANTSYQNTQNNSKLSQWSTNLTKYVLDCHLDIWRNRNETVHGKTLKEKITKARAAIIKKVKLIYRAPPKLANRYPPVNQIPIEHRLQRTTQQLEDWIHRIAHQVRITQQLEAIRPPGQLTIHEAFHNMRTLNKTDVRTKYPP